jgi:hypothetical protein
MANIFQSVRGNKPKRTAFNLSHDKKLTAKMGDLVPVLCEEVVPGDSFDIKTQSFIRMAPMIAPVMHKVDTYMHYFYVPNRIIWDKWEDFITGETLETPPILTSFQQVGKGTLSDYFGLPPFTTNSDELKAAKISNLPHRAYCKIFNEFYRDQNLQEEVIPENTSNWGNLQKRAWEKDYFTSALPWTQKGPEAVIPIGAINPNYSDTSLIFQEGTQTPISGELYAQAGTLVGETNPGSPRPARMENLDPDQPFEGDITINEFRIAHRIQKWFERQARAGSRYTETILSHFGVHTGDSRLDRPEYLGGGKQPVVISEVLNTNGVDNPDIAQDPLGQMAGHGVSVGNTAQAKRTFKEHGYIMCIMSVMPKPAYQNGIHKSWTRQDKFDFFWPEFAHLGEQEVKNMELFASGDDKANNETFGYQSRYAEYKYKGSSVHADMRNSPMDSWHMGRIFKDLPLLNAEFIECNTEAIDERIFAAGGVENDQLWIQIHHNIIARRPMPYYGTPTI